ncbi:MAG: neuromedin U [Deltaproteobacteria bacterium SG8_13]|nr:MAG: neuromedin U [Deltaproteobacteria bacterium SG8_13]
MFPVSQFFRFSAAIACIVLVTISLSNASAQEKGDDLRAKVQNPISSLVSLPFKFTFDYGAPNGEASFLNIQPVYPVTAGDWNLVSRLIVPLIDSPGEVTTPATPNPIPGNGATGLGDINYSLFFSPVKYDKWIWGVGPAITFPTATDDQLGSDKWSIGPTAVALSQPKWGSVGLLLRHLWSVAGEDRRADVNQSLIEPFINYNLPQGWYLITDLIITANWDAPSGQRWTVPLGGGAGKLFTIGSQAMNARIEAYYNIEKPDSAPDWQWGFTIQFLFPK